MSSSSSSSHKKRLCSPTVAIAIGLVGICCSLLRLPPASNAIPVSAFQPELYHGEGKTHHFFEGWYHKLVRTTVECGSNQHASNSDNNNNNNNTSSSSSSSLSMAVVPGVFYDSGNNGTGRNESHAFIFVTINGEKQHYYRFDLETEFQFRNYPRFSASASNSSNSGGNEKEEEYYVKIGNNTFSNHGVVLDLVPRFRQNAKKANGNENSNGRNENDNDIDDDDASIGIKGSIDYLDPSPWPIPSIRNLGAMGPVGYFLSPFLECYHDVLSFDHRLEGRLLLSKYDLTEGDMAVQEEEVFGAWAESGDSCPSMESPTSTAASVSTSRGYVEKDRGRSFPSLWIWMQTNSFRKPPHHQGTSLFFSVARIPILTHEWVRRFTVLPQLEFPGFTAAVWLTRAGQGHPRSSPSSSSLASRSEDTNDDGEDNNGNSHTTKQLIPFATWTGAYFEDLRVDEDSVVAILNSGGIGGGFWASLMGDETCSKTASAGSQINANEVAATCSILLRIGRYAKAWIGSWFVGYDSRKFRYKLELEADRRVPHVMLYAPKTTQGSSSSSSKMEPFVKEALHAKIRVRLLEYFLDETGHEHERLLLDDVGEHAGLEVHQNVQYLVDNLCGKKTASKLTCL